MTFRRELDDAQTEAAQVLASVMRDAWPGGKEAITDEDRVMLFAFAKQLVCGALVFTEKHHDYGPRNIAGGGEIGVVIRLNDKIQRLIHLRGKAEANEPKVDAAGDIGNYGFILRMVQDGDWPGVPPGWEL